MQSPRRRRRKFPFYKIQVFDQAIHSWRDEPKAVDSIEEAKAYIEKKLPSATARIIVIDEKGRRPLEQT
jgi:hypothetical protein